MSKKKNRKNHNSYLLDSFLYKASPELDIAGFEFSVSRLILIIIGCILVVPTIFLYMHLTFSSLLRIAAFIVFIIMPAYNYYVNVIHSRYLSESLFIIISSLLCVILKKFIDADIILLSFDILKLTESFLSRRQSDNTMSVLDLLPDDAYILNEGNLDRIKPSRIKKGDILGINVGDIIPADGIVIDGFSTVDYSNITKSSTNIAVVCGSKVYSGGINSSKPLVIKANCDYSDGVCQKIFDFCDDSLNRKTKQGSIVYKVLQFYVPSLLIVCLIAGIFSPLISHNWSESTKTVIMLLLLLCPYSIYSYIYYATVCTIGKIFLKGAVIKSGTVINDLYHASTFICNKTSTLTESEYDIEDVFPVGITINNLLSLVTKVESVSKHPIAKALRSYCGVEELEIPDGMTAKEIPGRGIIADISGNEILVGNSNFLFEYCVETQGSDKQGTVIHVAFNRKYCGYIVFTNKIRNNTSDSIEKIRFSGIKNMALLSCDQTSIVRSYANSLGFTVTKGEMKPEDKISVTDYFMENKSGNNTIIYIGNGTDELHASTHADISVATDSLLNNEAMNFADISILSAGIDAFPEILSAANKFKLSTYISLTLIISVKILVLILTLINSCHIILSAIIMAFASLASYCLTTFLIKLDN